MTARSKTALTMLQTLALAATLATSACSLPDFMTHPPQARGNKVEDDQLAQLIPGTSTRADAQALLGSPTTKATFDDNRWIYISEVTKPEIGAFNLVKDQRVVTLTFDQGGVLRGIERKGRDDRMDVAVIGRTTPAPGTDASFIQQLLGNIGKFNPGGASNGAGAGRGVSGNY